MVEWEATAEDFWSAEAKLDVGGVIYLSVESLGPKGWDWVMWDTSCQALPRHGLAATKNSAKRQAEQSLQEVNIMLLEVLGGSCQVGALSSTS